MDYKAFLEQIVAAIYEFIQKVFPELAEKIDFVKGEAEDIVNGTEE